MRAIAFQWPDWKKQGWTIDDVSENADLVRKRSEGPGRPKRPAISAFRPAGQRFHLSFRAVRSIPRQGNDVSPDAARDRRAPCGRPARSSWRMPRTSSRASIRLPRRRCGPLRRNGGNALNVPESFRGLHQVALRVDSAVQAFDASVAVQKQQIETESTAQVEVQEGRLQVTQRISYHVSYERLAEGALVLPKELRRSDVQFRLDRSDSDFEAIPSWTPGEADSGDVARIALEPHRIGSFDIFARYFVPLAEPATNEAVDRGDRASPALARRRLQGDARRAAGAGRHGGGSH